MLLSACMIVKNEEEMLKKTLPVLASSVDEIILIDTGSTDNTVEIAKANGAEVYHFPWINDFSAARNESLKHAQGEWIIWIDADEMVKKEELLKLRKFLSSSEKDFYSIRIYECRPDTFESPSFYFRTKIFRNRKGFYFKRPINEHLVNPEDKIVCGDLISSFSIYHWGRHGKETIKRKRNRNISLLTEALKNNRNDKHYHFLLAINYKGLGFYEKAVHEFQKAIELDNENQFTSSAYVEMGWCLYNLKKPKEAYQAAMKALEISKKQEVSAYNILGALAFLSGHPTEAILVLKKADTVEPNNELTKHSDINNTRYLANLFMGQAYEKLNQKAEARGAFEEAYKLKQTDEVKQKLGELKWA